MKNKSKKDPNRQYRGAVSKAQGALFERIIDATCDNYRRQNKAVIEKTPEPMKPIKSLGKGRFVAHFEKQAQPDYKGALNNGRAIVFEAKHTEKDRIERSRLTEEQMNSLEAYSKIGAICFVLVSVGMDKFYRVPWDAWKNMKNIFGYKHMKLKDLEVYRIPEKNGLIMLLEGLVD